MYQNLSPAEKEVYHLLLQNITQKEMAAKRCCSLKTIKYHCTSIYKKMGVENKQDLLMRTIYAPEYIAKNRGDLPEGLYAR